VKLERLLALACAGEIIALIDSDNILPSENWLKRMVEPFVYEEISGKRPARRAQQAERRD